MSYQVVTPVYDFYVRTLCYRPYPGHKQGCPNYGKKAGCPPGAPVFMDIVNKSYPIFAIWNGFDLASHVERMLRSNPHWTERQLYCCLYWQPKARKQLEGEIHKFILDNPGCAPTHYRIFRCPEAMGINVTATMAQIGEELEWPPKTIAYQVALAGWVRDPVGAISGR